MTRAAGRTAALRSGAVAPAQVLGINAVRFGVPIGLLALMVLHPGIFTHYLWILAESLGIPGVLGAIIGWGIVIVPLAFVLSWMLLSVRLLRLAGWLFAGLACACQHLDIRLAARMNGQSCMALPSPELVRAREMGCIHVCTSALGMWFSVRAHTSTLAVHPRQTREQGVSERPGSA